VRVMLRTWMFNSIDSDYSVNRDYTQVATRPQTKSYKAVMNYRWGRVRPANMMIFLKKHILRPANMKLQIPKILFLRVVVLNLIIRAFAPGRRVPFSRAKKEPKCPGSGHVSLITCT